MHLSRGEKIFNVFNIIVLGGVGLLAIYPFIYTLSISFSSAAEAIRPGLHLFPRDVSVMAYEMSFRIRTSSKGSSTPSCEPCWVLHSPYFSLV